MHVILEELVKFLQGYYRCELNLLKELRPAKLFTLGSATRGAGEKCQGIRSRRWDNDLCRTSGAFIVRTASSVLAFKLFCELSMPGMACYDTCLTLFAESSVMLPGCAPAFLALD